MVQQSCRASALYHGGLAWLVPNLTVGTLDTEAPRAGMEDHWAPPWNEQFPVRTRFHGPKPERKWTYINAQPSIFRGNLVCTVSFREGNSKLFLNVILNGSWSKEERNQDMPNENECKWRLVEACSLASVRAGVGILVCFLRLLHPVCRLASSFYISRSFAQSKEQRISDFPACRCIHNQISWKFVNEPVDSFGLLSLLGRIYH